jgi:CDP-glucose 4,6-dehydratase
MFNNIFENKKIIVTGHTGFKGAWLTLWLLHLKANVVGISKYIPSNPSLFEILELEKNIKHYTADVTDALKIKEIINLEQPDFIFHLAAQPIVSESYVDPYTTFHTNIMGSANILDALRSYTRPCNVVMITSDKCYENVEWIWGYRENDELGGKDPYSASKGAAEIVIRSYVQSFYMNSENIKIVSVRAGNVIGGGDWALNRIVPDCMRSWAEKKQVTLRNPSSTRPWQHVLEPLSGYLRAAQVMFENKKPLQGESFNFGPNAEQDYSVLDLLKKILEYSSFTQEKEHFKIESNNNFHEAGLLKLNCDKAKQYFDWLPALNFDKTAAFTASWYDEYYNKKTAKSIKEFTWQQIVAYTLEAKEKNIAWAL